MQTSEVTSSNQSSYLSSMLPTGSQILSNVCRVALPIIALTIASSLPGVSAGYYECVQGCIASGGDSIGCSIFCGLIGK